MFKDKIERLYRVNLNLKKGEKLLVFTDDEKPYNGELLEEFLEVAKVLGVEAKGLIYKSLKQHGKEPPKELWELVFSEECIENLERLGLFERVIFKEDYSQEEVFKALKDCKGFLPDVVVAFPYYSTTHTFFRKLLTDYFKSRYASMPLFEPQMFLTSMDVDWREVAKLSEEVSQMLTEGEFVEVKSDYGVSLEFSIKGRRGIADTGLFHRGGEFGNLPAGEGFIAPVEEEAFGKLTILYAPDRKLERPLTLKFINGRVEEIEGFEDYRKELEEVFKRYPNANFIAEFGVGTNPKASRPDNILEAEKILGTIHIAVGDNHTFGGKNKVPFHTDYVVFEPTVIIGGRGWKEEVLLRGKLTIL